MNKAGIFSFLFRVGCFFITSVMCFWAFVAIAEPVYNKIHIKESRGDYLDIIYLVSALILIISVLSFFLWKCFFSGNKAFQTIDEKAEVEGLVTAFYDMVRAIEGRDVGLENAKEYAEKQSIEKNNFLMSVSHELRTPMHAILNFAEMGKNRVSSGDTEKVQMYFSRIEESGERLLKLINEVLGLTSLESDEVAPKIEENCLIEVVESCVNELESLIDLKNIKVKVINKIKDQKNLFDKDQMHQVVINLLSNAIKFTPDGKKIVFHIDNKDGGVMLSVMNEGNAIPEKDLENIFNKFVQSSSISPGVGGSGIGLAICKEIVRLHDGKIWAENFDKGVKVSLLLCGDKKAEKGN